MRLALPEVKLGVLPGSGGTVRVPRRVGEGRAKELMFTGEPIDAETARAWGLVNRVVPPGQALVAALELARTLAERPNRALQLIKEAVDLAQDTTEDDAIRRTLDPVRGGLPHGGLPRGRSRVLREGAAPLAPPIASRGR